jgi:hypothetical protein
MCHEQDLDHPIRSRICEILADRLERWHHTRCTGSYRKPAEHRTQGRWTRLTQLSQCVLETHPGSDRRNHITHCVRPRPLDGFLSLRCTPGNPPSGHKRREHGRHEGHHGDSGHRV